MVKLEREIKNIKIRKNIGVITIFIMGFLLVIGGIWINKDIFVLNQDLKTELLKIDINDTTTYDEYILLIFGVVVVFIGFLSMFIVKTMNKILYKQIEEYKTTDKWDYMITDYEMSPIIKYKSISLQLGNRYLYSFLNGITIIDYEEIMKVYFVKKINEDYEYIEIETKDNKKYRVASKPNNIKISEFQEAIEIIRDKSIKMLKEN